MRPQRPVRKFGREDAQRALPEAEQMRSRGSTKTSFRSAGIAAVFALVACARVAAPAPPLAIASLAPDSSPADTMRSYVATVMVLKSAVHERDTILRGCAAPADGGSNSSRADFNPHPSAPPAEQLGEAGARTVVPSSDESRVASLSAVGGRGKTESAGLVDTVAGLVGRLLRQMKVSW